MHAAIISLPRCEIIAPPMVPFCKNVATFDSFVNKIFAFAGVDRTLSSSLGDAREVSPLHDEVPSKKINYLFNNI